MKYSVNGIFLLGNSNSLLRCLPKREQQIRLIYECCQLLYLQYSQLEITKMHPTYWIIKQTAGIQALCVTHQKKCLSVGHRRIVCFTKIMCACRIIHVQACVCTFIYNIWIYNIYHILESPGKVSKPQPEKTFQWLYTSGACGFPQGAFKECDDIFYFLT